MGRQYLTRQELLDQNRGFLERIHQLESELDESQNTLDAIHSGAVDAIVVSTEKGEQIFTLKGAEHPYRVIVETMNEGAATLDQNGRIVYCNRKLADMLKTPLEKLIGSSIDRFFDPGKLPILRTLIRHGQTGRLQTESAFTAETGVTVPVLLSVSPLELQDEPGTVCLVAADLTEQKRNEEIVASDRLAKLIFDQTAEAFIVCDVDGSIIRASQEAIRLVQQDLHFQPFDAIIPLHASDDSGKGRKFSIQEILRGDVLRKVEFTYAGQNRSHDLLVSAGPIWSGDKIAGCVVVMIEITERKEREKALIESENRMLKQKHTLDALMAATADYIFMIDREGRYLYANPQVLNLLGIELEKIIGKTWRDLRLAPEVLEPFSEKISTVLETGKAVRDETFFPVEGEYHMYEYEINPVMENGCVQAVAISARDITDRKRMEEQLKQQTARLEETNEELEAFIYSVSHDLQGPVRAMDGFARIILDQYGNDMNAEFRRKFDVIRENSKLMSDLIDGLLNLSRVGRAELSISRLNMNDLFENVWRELSAANPERNFELLKRDLPPVRGDQSLIRQVFYNLLANAVKFTEHRAKAVIEIGSYSDDGRNVYCVKDNGAGFDMRYYDKLFRVFQRLHSTSEFKGTGIGLALVQRIVHRHGGRVWAEGRVDEGATFFFSLPAEKVPTFPGRR